MIDRPLYVDKIMAYVDTPFVKILTGVRRCGKSTILKMIMERLKTERNIPENRIISCRFDSMEYEDMTAKQIYTLLKEKLSPVGKNQHTVAIAHAVLCNLRKHNGFPAPGRQHQEGFPRPALPGIKNRVLRLLLIWP